MGASARIADVKISLSDSSLAGNLALLDAEANRLKDEIRFACSVDVKNAVAPAPYGSRPIDVPAVGVLIVAVPLGKQIILKVLGLVDTWLANRPTRKIQLEFRNQKIVMDGVTARDMRQIVAKIAEEYSLQPRSIPDEGSASEEGN